MGQRGCTLQKTPPIEERDSASRTLPEEGKAAETADAVDALSDAEKRARDAEKDALKAAEAVSAAKD